MGCPAALCRSHYDEQGQWVKGLSRPEIPRDAAWRQSGLGETRSVIVVESLRPGQGRPSKRPRGVLGIESANSPGSCAHCDRTTQAKPCSEIARPVREVFAFVADQTNAPQWQTDLHEVRRLTDGPIGVGSEHEFVRTFAGRRFASRNRFVAFEDGR